MLTNFEKAMELTGRSAHAEGLREIEFPMTFIFCFYTQ
ncbi:hypothetical protein DCCM_4725 [Desulfocucumis palustris]|uniref:Uncharacterized protein n=1 Tax=Desulfocucumis palustris TaxID=1898651 RepID=A0A2L2XMN0_9FIRM|nr:hypothetical protein DCCM_4725 [Desulfocucumis palustris]